jgi:hypothetical protein
VEIAPDTVVEKATGLGEAGTGVEPVLIEASNSFE